MPKHCVKLFLVKSLCLFLFCDSSFALKQNTSLLNCANQNRLIIAAVGDVLLHIPLQIKGRKWGFESIWQEAIPYVKSADLAFVNIEGPMAYGVSYLGDIYTEEEAQINGQVYTGYPLFNYSPQVASALKRSGFDVATIANNHLLDRGSVGIDRTLEVLDSAGLLHAGVRAKNSEAPWYTISRKKGFTIGWIACTEHTNGNKDSDHQVLHCYDQSDQKRMLSMITKLKAKTDAVIVTPHWGAEFQTKHNQGQKKLAIKVLEAGATAVIGSHPHVLQPVEHYRTHDGRNTVIAYSLGNFVSLQETVPRQSTVILFLSLVRKNGQVVLGDVAYVPAFMDIHCRLGDVGLQILHQLPTDSSGFRTLSAGSNDTRMLFGDKAFVRHFCSPHTQGVKY